MSAGLRRRNSQYAAWEEELLRKTVERSRSIKSDEEFYRHLDDLQKELNGRTIQSIMEKLERMNLKWHYQPKRTIEKQNEEVPEYMWKP